MKLLFKQKFFSWFDRYDIYDEAGRVVYTVRGELSWGHLLRIYDAGGRELGHIKQELWTWMSTFHMYVGDEKIGSIKREFSWFAPKYNIDCNGWHIEGDWTEWEYRVKNSAGVEIATVSKEIWKLTDTYVIDVRYPEDALYALMLVLAIDAEKCSRDSS